jgi:hypothetical protein
MLGLAGLAGVAATGAVLARDERQRRAYSPDDVRARLQERHAELDAPAPEAPAGEPPSRQELVGGRRHRLARSLSRRR